MAPEDARVPALLRRADMLRLLRAYADFSPRWLQRLLPCLRCYDISPYMPYAIVRCFAP